FDVDGKGKEGVDQRKRVGAGVFGTFCHLSDGGDVGRELHDQGPPRNRLDARDQLVEDPGISAKDHSPVLGVGTRGVQLVGGDARGRVKRFDYGYVVSYLVTEDIGDTHRAGGRPQSGNRL